MTRSRSSLVTHKVCCRGRRYSSNPIQALCPNYETLPKDRQHFSNLVWAHTIFQRGMHGNEFIESGDLKSRPEPSQPPVTPPYHYLPCLRRRSTLVQLWLRSRLRLPSLQYGGDGLRAVPRTLLDRKGTRLLGTCLIFQRIPSGRNLRGWPRSMVSDDCFRGSYSSLGV